jgi:hypothetical protein
VNEKITLIRTPVYAPKENQPLQMKRRDLVGCLIHEHELAAA